MKEFLKNLWYCWKEVQEERARWYAKTGSSWE